MNIKCISLWQPHAWAMAEGHKIYETRAEEFVNLPGVRNYRGPLAIHAAKKAFDPLDLDYEDFGSLLLSRQLREDGFKELTEDLVYGAVLAIVDLVDIHSAEHIRNSLSPKELIYGNYEYGRYALETTNLRRLAIPRFAKGHQGLFYWDVFQPIAEGLKLLQCDGFFGPKDGKHIPCPNAGMLWRIKFAAGSTTFRLCSACYNAYRKNYPAAIFTYVGKEAARHA